MVKLYLILETLYFFTFQAHLIYNYFAFLVHVKPIVQQMNKTLKKRYVISHFEYNHLTEQSNC